MKNLLEFKKYVAKFLVSHQPILDIGCGEGNFLQICKELNLEAQGIEINERKIEICKNKNLIVNYGNALKLDFDNETFGGIFSSHLIEHFVPQDAFKFVSEVYRILKKNGIFICVTPNPKNYFVLLGFFENDWTHVKPYGDISLKKLMQDAGFRKTVPIKLFERQNLLKRIYVKLLFRHSSHYNVAIFAKK